MTLSEALLLSRKRGICIILFFMSIFFSLTVGSAEALSGLSRITSRNFLLHGDLNFYYQKTWGDVQEEDRFSHEYNLVLDGFVLDPRLVLFELRGSFSQEIINPGTNYDDYGFGTTLSLLNTRVLRGPLQYFPQPIQLRFDYHKTTDLKSHSYGLSLAYEIQKNLVFFRNGRFVSLESVLPPADLTDKTFSNGNGEEGKQRKGFIIPFPKFFLDYDSLDRTFDDSGRKSKEDILSLRAESLTRNSEYRFEYRYDKTSDTGTGADFTFKDQSIELRADYHFLDDKTARTLDIYNRLYHRDIQNTSYTDISSRGILLKRFGPDLADNYSVTGGGRYFTSDDNSAYSGDLSGSYTRQFSERLSNTLTGTIAYNNTQLTASGSIGLRRDGSSYSAAISDNLSYRLSNIFLLFGGMTAGVADSAPIYNFNIGLSTSTRIATSTIYSYNHTGSGSDERDSHQITFDASTVLPMNVYFTTRNFYLIEDLRNGEISKLLSLRSDIYWNILPFRFNLGLNYLSLKRTTERGLDIDIAATQVHATLSRSFTRRLFFAVRAAYAQTKAGVSYLELDPSLTWAFRRVFLTAHYTLRKTESEKGDPLIDHRFYLTVQRTFEQTLRPFF